MIRRLLDVLAILAGVLALGLLVALAASYVAPRSVGIERYDWYSSQDRDIRTTLLQVSAGQVTPFTFELRSATGSTNIGPFPPRPPGQDRVEQVDLTLILRDAKPLRGYRVGDARSILRPTIAVASVSIAFAFARFVRRRPSPRTPHRRRRQLVVGLGLVATTSLVASVVFCVRSYPYFDRVDCAVPFIAGPEAIQVNSSRGSAMIAWTHAGPNHTLGDGRLFYTRSTIPATRGPLWQAAELLPDRFEQAFGFTLGTDGGSTLPRNVLIAPYWAIVLALAGVIAVCVRTLRRLRDRDAVDRCKRCGYDCRGLAERCPECGTAIAAARS